MKRLFWLLSAWVRYSGTGSLKRCAECRRWHLNGWFVSLPLCVERQLREREHDAIRLEPRRWVHTVVDDVVVACEDVAASLPGQVGDPYVVWYESFVADEPPMGFRYQLTKFWCRGGKKRVGRLRSP